MKMPRPWKFAKSADFHRRLEKSRQKGSAFPAFPQALFKKFTGIDDPYEPPVRPELVMKTVGKKPEEIGREIYSYMNASGFLKR
jgi:adenylylsulfate kinase-like enzyme